MEFISNLLTEFGLKSGTVVYLSNIVMILFIAVLSILANFVTKKIVLKIISGILTKNKLKWDDFFLENQVFHKLSHIVPALIIYSFASTFPRFQVLIEKGASIYFIIVAMIVVNACINAVDDIYKTYEVSKVKPIKGFLQVSKLIVFIFGIILVIANFIGQSPIILLSGLGALSAVLMLIFKDTLLGLVAGVQLTSNDMLRVGDWIEMPKYQADGDVIDISLNTVKVMNFDKTITTIPAYALISDSFRNWRGMRNAGGRRIKRSIYIDTSSITFCTPEKIEQFKSIQFLRDYMIERQKEIDEYNEKHQIDKSSKVNGRQMTNIGVFRAYILNYLKNHPRIHQEMMMIVRQMAPGEHGLPLEIYAFANDTNWVVYESVQSDIFDHIFAVAPEFGIRIFQSPMGHDLKQLLDSVSFYKGAEG